MVDTGSPRVYADFNTAEGTKYWILWYKDVPLNVTSESEAEQLGLRAEQRVVLYQDEGDFDVFAVLRFGFLETLKKKTWFAEPDWGTKTKYGALN